VSAIIVETLKNTVT